MIPNGLRLRSAAVFAFTAIASGAMLAGAASADDWPTYLHDSARSSTSGETTLSPSNVSQMTPLWRFQTEGGVAAGPVVVGGVVYVGSWDGYEYALDAATGALKWKTFLGTTGTTDPSCSYPTSAGVTSTATVVNGVLYVGGGDNYWYALDASTGTVLWKVLVGSSDGSYDGHYNWASPLIYNGSAYIGISGLDDCPLVQGKLLRVDLSTHQVVATFDAAPDGAVGGGIWTSPTVDSATNTIYVTTGTQTDQSQLDEAAMVSLDATTLAVEGSWQVPLAQQVSDNDWGNTPTLISGGLVAATNKNGVVYAFQRSNISAGPVWQFRDANGGACPTCGDGSVSSSAFDGNQLYVAGATTNINGTQYPGSLSALNPATGVATWTDPLSGYVIPALAVSNGLVFAGVGSNFIVFNASNGQQLYSYATGNTIYSPPSVSGGSVFIGSQDDYLYAFGLSSSAPPPPPNTVRVNAGAGGYLDSAGNSWSSDCCNSGGNTYSTTAAIAGTSDPTLYQSERWNAGPFTYTFTGLAAGSYQVTLKFAEIAYLGPGARQFNVAIQGSQVLTNFDVAAQVGFNTALDKTFTASVGSNGQLTVTFSQGAADNPIVSAIQVVPAGSSGSLSFASGPQTLTAGQPSQAMQVSASAAPASSASVALSSSSGSGQFSTSSSGPWQSTLTVPIAAGQTESGNFYYQDTKGGSPTLTASASGYSSATQTETVTAAALASLAVSPASATLATGGNQLFTASGQDQYGNPVAVSSAAWTTSAPGSVSPSSGTQTTFTASSSTGSGQVTATIGSISGSAAVTVSSSQTAGTIRVNAGGGGYIDSAGNSWSSDCCNSGGSTYSTTAAIAGTSDPTLYQSERWNAGPFTYTFTGLAAGSYQVTLKFAEIAGLGPGQRQFNVAINGTAVLTNFDVAAQVGFNTALDKTFTASVGSNGQLTVAFTQGAANNPIVSAIQIVPSMSASASLSFSTSPQTLTAAQPSTLMRIGLSATQASAVSVTLASSSQSGEFATSAGGPWSSTLSVTIPAGQAASPGFYYKDTHAGTPTLTASATGVTSATQAETVTAAALATISVSPSSATVSAGGTTAFTATGADIYGNPVSVAGAAWTTNVPGGSVSPASGATTTFKAGSASGSGSVKATIGTITGSAAVTVASIPPSNLTATPRGKRIGLSWQSSAGGVTYTVFRGTAAGHETAYASKVTGTSFTDASVTTGTTYFYYVVAVGSGGAQSAPSNEASATAR